jgi:hypothetical protein
LRYGSIVARPPKHGGLTLALGGQAWWSEWTIDGCILEIADVLVAMREAPRCNQIRSMSELAMPLQDTSVEINIGHAQSAWRTGQLK